MDPLTPKKIQKLINLAEGRSFVEKLLITEEDLKLIRNGPPRSTSPARYESSSGILDLEHVEGFGENGSIANMSLSKSTAFNPGEMTGRSTGADDVSLEVKKSNLEVPRRYGCHSIDLDSIISEMDKQTNEINEIMRHSIATNTNYSFQSKRDLTADEASLIAREAPLPVLTTTQTYFQDSILTNNTSNISVGTYFKNRCVEFNKILGKTDSPDRSMMPSITEVSSSINYEHQRESNILSLDDMLDSVPVRQPKNTDHLPSQAQTYSDNTQKALFKEPVMPKVIEKPSVKEPLSEIPTPSKSVIPHKLLMTSSKPTDVLLKNLQASFRVGADETEGSIENSFSISKIADYLGNQSNVSVTDMMQLNQKRPALKKQPLTELQMNTIQETPVTYLTDSKKTETASSTGTVTTVISVEKLNINDDSPQYNVPEVVITHSKHGEDARMRSKSPSTKSASTLSTVRDNYSSFKSGDSPNSSKGEANRSKIPSPNIAYKELDKSVDWQEVLLQKRNRQRGVAKEHLVEVETTPVAGYVGVSTAITMSVTTLSDSWLTAKFQFNSLPNEGKELNVELPRLPLLLSPGKSENFTFYLTSNVELDTILPFTFFVKDSSVDGDVEQNGELQVKFRLPIIQAMSSDGINKITYPPIQEKSLLTKTFALISDCPADLQIKLFISEGDDFFWIKNVQEIRKSDVNKAIMERQVAEEKASKGKAKMQLCRITSGSAIKVSVTFEAPTLAKIQTSSPTLNGALDVTLINGNTILRRVDLVGVVGTPELVIKSHQHKIKVTKEPIDVTVTNTGLVSGNWTAKCKTMSISSVPFIITPNRFALAPNESKNIQMMYTGAEDVVHELFIRFEETTTGKSSTELSLIGGNEKPKSFPIKSNHNNLSWVKPGRKEVSLKNNIDKKVHIRCNIVGEGFTIDLPGGEARGIYVLSFNACECRPLPILFTPTSCMPHSATLHIVYDRNSEFCRKIKLFGWSGGQALRWSGLVTFSETAALVRAASRAPLDLKLHNKAAMPAFLAARIHFNLQYTQVEPSSRLIGALKVVPARSYHTVSLRMDWARVERRAREAGTTALATVTVLTGAEITRRRILKIFKDESNGKLDPSKMPEHLRVLAKEFEGEDTTMDNFFVDFNEPKTALNELMGGLRELTAHIDLPQDFAEDNTIIISDDTVVEHHTLCD